MSRISQAFVAFVASLVCVPALWAQDLPQPGPEHKKLKELEGTWDAVMKMGDAESKGTMVWKMDLGGLWLVSDFQGDFGGMKFSGKGMDGYDPIKKKYVSVWVDSMSTSPMLSEGTYDKDGKTLTMTGEGPGADGKPAKYKMTTEYKDKDTIFWTMYGPGPDGKEGMQFTISYKRRK
jgi:Protein of unknown function (DUF1579)